MSISKDKPYLTTNDFKTLNDFLSKTKEIENFSAYVANNYKTLSESEIATINSFLRFLPSLSDETNWQLIIRSFCFTLYKNLVNHTLRVIKINGYNEKLSILIEIYQLALNVILSDIPPALLEDKNGKQQLKEIIFTITYLIMPDEKKYKIAIRRLKELGLSPEELLEIEKIKEAQQRKIDEYNNKRKKGA